MLWYQQTSWRCLFLPLRIFVEHWGLTWTLSKSAALNYYSRLSSCNELLSSATQDFEGLWGKNPQIYMCPACLQSICSTTLYFRLCVHIRNKLSNQTSQWHNVLHNRLHIQTLSQKGPVVHIDSCTDSMHFSWLCGKQTASLTIDMKGSFQGEENTTILFSRWLYTNENMILNILSLSANRSPKSSHWAFT